MNNVRFIVWWIFKAPWTKKYGVVKTLSLALNAFFFRTSNTGKITVCVSSSNRIKQLSEVFFPSIQKLQKIEQIEFVLVCDEKEFALIERMVKEFKIENITLLSSSNKFSRAAYINIALDFAGTENVFISDVDIELPNNLVHLYRKNVQLNKAWFPICDLLDEQGKLDSKYPEGSGLVGFVNSNELRLDSTIDSWGNEDWQFLYLLFDHGNYPKRTQNDGFLHHFHLPVDKKNYKKSW